MVRYITVLIGLLVFSTMSVIVLSLMSFEHNRLVNVNIGTLGEDYYTNRVKLFAVPVDPASSVEFDKVDRLQWYAIRQEMLKSRKEIDALDMRPIHLDLVAIVLFSISCVGILIYSPALWVAEFRFGNEVGKFIFNFSMFSMMLSATLIRTYVYFGVIRRNYGIITEMTRKVVQRIGGIKFPQAIHYCYQGYATKNVYLPADELDWHHFSPKTHLHMDRVAAAASYCHADLVDVSCLFFCVLSCAVHFCLFVKTTRWNKSRLQLLQEMEAAENFDPATLNSSDDESQSGDKKSKVKGLKRTRFLPDRNPSPLGAAPVKLNEVQTSVIETLMDSQQLKELRDAYLSNYYLLHAPKRTKSGRSRNDPN